MRKYLLLNALLVGFSLIGITRAQDSRPNPQALPESSSATLEQPLFDDDGGRVFIVRRNPGALTTLRHHGGAVISQPQQYNIFLGSGWSDPGLRQREAVFANLLSNKGIRVDQLALESYGVKNTFLPSGSYEQPYDFSSDHSISDLQVRRVLEEMLETRTIQGGLNYIYIVFLPPGVNSKLGSMIGGKHFTAYHNFFHAKPDVINYVVLPFEPEMKVARQSAARALIGATVNPTGDGWY